MCWSEWWTQDMERTRDSAGSREDTWVACTDWVNTCSSRTPPPPATCSCMILLCDTPHVSLVLSEPESRLLIQTEDTELILVSLKDWFLCWLDYHRVYYRKNDEELEMNSRVRAWLICRTWWLTSWCWGDTWWSGCGFMCDVVLLSWCEVRTD